MPNETTIYTLYPEAEIDQYVRYFDGQFLGSQDFVDVQRYLIDRIRRGLDLYTVPGVARGLALSSPGAWVLKIAPGTAIDDRGRLLVAPAVIDNIAVPQEWGGKTVDVAIAYAEAAERVQGGTSEEAGTRGATRIREVPEVRFYAAGLTPADQAVALARVNVAADGTCTFTDPDPIRRRAGLRLPSEDGVDSPSLRDAGPARPRTIAVDGTVSVGGKLAVGTLDPEAEVDLRGVAKLDVLHVREKAFRVEGDVGKFYPIVWEDLGASSGALVLELTRANADHDAAGAGSLVALFRAHATDGANGSVFLSLEIHQSKRFIAAYSIAKTRKVIIWLRGQRTYSWRSNHNARLLDATAVDSKKIDGNNFVAKDSIVPALDYDRVKIHAPLDQHEISGPLSVDGDLSYGGKISKLDSAEVAAATVRAYDFNFGHTTRRGSPGRAFVDNKDTLVVNFGADWAKTQVASPLLVVGDTSIGGALAVGNDSARKNLDVSGAAQIDQTLTVDGAVSLGGNVTIGADSARRSLDVSGSLQVDQGLTVGGKVSLQNGLDVSGGPTNLGGYLNVGTAEATKNLYVSGTTTLDQALKVNAGSQVSTEDTHLQLRREKSETTGGAKLFLELYQDDPQKKVPEVSTAIRFHHNNRYWHRIEGDAAGLHVRDGNPSNNDYKALFTGDFTSSGRITGSAMTLANRATVGQLGIVHEEFKVGGDRNTFYPIVFNQDGWDSGHYELEICRPNIHTDEQGLGSMVARFEGHTPNWGHNSDWGRAHIRQYKLRFVANWTHHSKGQRVIVWLRGNCTYRWRASTSMSLVDYGATNKNYNSIAYNSRTDIVAQFNQDTVYIGPEASGQIETDLKIIRGTVSAAGAVVAGSGYSVGKTGNCWVVTYAIPFSGEVTVVATQQYPNDNDHDNTGDTRDNAVIVASLKTEVWIKTGNGSGDRDWRRFHFIAMGQG